MRTSVFVRPPEVHYITLHEDLYRICRGNACAAMLMDYFIREHDRRLWEDRVRQDGPEDESPERLKWKMVIQVSVEFLCDIVVWSYSKSSVSDAIKSLSEWGMIRIIKQRPKWKECDRRHYIVVDQAVVQELFTNLAKGEAPSKNSGLHSLKSGNGSSELGKSLVQSNSSNEMPFLLKAEDQQIHLEERTQSPKGNPPSSPPQECPPPPPTPLVQKPRPRNLLGEAALQACQIDPTTATKTQWGAAVAAVKQIKDAYPAVTPQDLLDLGGELRRRWGKDVTGFTPMTLSKHWRPPAASGSGLPESTLPELEAKIRACRGFHHHIDHEKATEEEHAEYARLLAKRRTML